MKKTAFLSNVNIDPLRHRFENAGQYKICFSGYNQWQAEMLDDNSQLNQFCPDYVFIYLNCDEKNFNINDLISAVQSFTVKNPDCRMIISNFLFKPLSVHTYHDRSESENTEMNRKLNQLSADNQQVLIFNFNRLIQLHGYNSIFDNKYWYLGRIKFSNSGFNLLFSELNNFLNSIQGKVKKLLVLDADNTLWGGVAAEDGWQNLQIGNEGIGRIYLDFQSTVIELKKQGVLLALCSKNYIEDVLNVFENNTNMLLKWDDFVSTEVNWQPKSENLLHLAEVLNISTESMVFIDDNALERAIVANEVPGVAVPEFPKEISTLNDWFINEVVYTNFARHSLTNEDFEKTAQYQRNAKRQLAKQTINYDDYLRNLDIRLDIRSADKTSYTRIAQLTQKTNQFNLSLKRYTDIEILNFIERTDYLVYCISYEDKFGNEGIVGCSIVKIENSSAEIDSFMLSCRVLGRKIEFSFMDYIIKSLKNRGIERINLHYCATERNIILKTFLENYGFNTNDNSHYKNY